MLAMETNRTTNADQQGIKFLPLTFAQIEFRQRMARDYDDHDWYSANRTTVHSYQQSRGPVEIIVTKRLCADLSNSSPNLWPLTDRNC